MRPDTSPIVLAKQEADHATVDVISAEAAAVAAIEITKAYGGSLALNQVSLSIASGSIHSLIGENGAGKSTLVRILSGLEHADGGVIRYFGSDLPARVTSADLVNLGVAVVHQDPGLVPDLSVAENVALAAGFRGRHSRISWRQTRANARRILKEMGIAVDVDSRVDSLPIAVQSAVGIGRSLATDPRVLILDEPTANLSEADAIRLHEAIRNLRAAGRTVLLVSHNLDEVLSLSDGVTVLRDGQVAFCGPVQNMTRRDLVELMLGRSLTEGSTHQVVHDTGRVTLRFEDAVRDEFGPIDLDVRAGEVVGITGRVNSGYLEVAKTAAGQLPLTGGSANVDGNDARRSGRVQYVPPDRATSAVAAQLTLRENLFLNPSGGWRVKPRAERAAAAKLLRTHDVRPIAPEAQLLSLSGGNAQKLVLARSLHQQPNLLVLAEPTVAVDVGAREQIHARVREAASDGVAVLVASSDADELADVCDRVFVCERGRLVRELHRPQAVQIRKAIHDID